jgi:hypothetical protein
VSHAEDPFRFFQTYYIHFERKKKKSNDERMKRFYKFCKILDTPKAVCSSGKTTPLGQRQSG